MITDSEKIFYLACLILFGWLVYLLAPILTPFAVSALLAYMGDPLVDQLEEKKLSRSFAVVVIFMVMLTFLMIFLLIIIPVLEQQIINLIQRLPMLLDWVESGLIPYLSSVLGVDENVFDMQQMRQGLTENWRQVGSVAGKVLSQLTQSGQAMLAIIANVILIPVVSFYLLRDWDHLMERIHELIPRSMEPLTVKLAKECDAVLGEFLHGQLLLMLAQAIFYSVALWMIGLEFSLLIGMLAGLVSFVPYLGVIVGVVVAGIAAFVQYQEFLPILYVLIIFGVGQALEGMLLSPWLVGDRIGLHPVAVIFAVMAGGQLFGFLGVLLALPVAAIIVIFLRHVHEHYLESKLYTE